MRLAIIPSLLIGVSLFGCNEDDAQKQLAGQAAGYAAVANAWPFNAVAPRNDLSGAFEGEVSVAQSQIMPAGSGVPGDSQPHLVAGRQALLMLRPISAISADKPLQVAVKDKSGATLGTLSLNPPDKQPKTAYFVDGAPEGGIDFTPPSGAQTTISSNADLAKLDDPNGAFLRGKLGANAMVNIQTADGSWVKTAYLPADASFEGKMIRFQSQAGYGSTVRYSSRAVDVSRGDTLLFKYVNGQWFRQGELDNNRIVYAQNLWSAVLPAAWVKPGMSLQFSHASKSGTLAKLEVGPATQLLINTIDIGMLVEPRRAFAFANDPGAHREYLQTVPLNQLLVAQYEPVHLKEVMLPDGSRLTQQDPSEGGWHTGTMREDIGKELISTGINYANYGVNSTAGRGADFPLTAALLTAHNSQGRYANGVQVHGGSGGGGVVTLDASLGNEFSHEVGHNYGLGHYVGGFDGSVHRPAGAINSSWGWDADLKRFLPNFSGVVSNQDTCMPEGKPCQTPFAGRSYGLDAMAGGSPMSAVNRFTLYTPYVAKRIQQFLESKPVFDPASATGFSLWNASSQSMQPYPHRIAPDTATVPLEKLSEAYLAEAIGKADRALIKMEDGYWTREVKAPAASAANKGKLITIDNRATYATSLLAPGQTFTITGRSGDNHFVSDGRLWVKTQSIETDRKPQRFGVPVTTLLGYYDPEMKLTSYIYPALRGAYGYSYPDDGASASSAQCQLQVDTASGQLKFKLQSTRVNGEVMNKFHVNVPSALQPQNAKVVCGGKALASKAVPAASGALRYTINGVLQ